MIYSTQSVEHYGSQKDANNAFQRAITEADRKARKTGKEFLVANDCGEFFVLSRPAADATDYPLLYSSEE